MFQMSYGPMKRSKIMERFFAICILRSLVLLAFGLALAGMEVARATTIQISLGPPGTLSTDQVVPFTDVNGTSLSSQNLSLDFVFSGNEFVRLFSVTTNFEVSVRLQTNSPGIPGFLSGTGFLSDQLGNPLHSPLDLGTPSFSDGSMIAGLFPLFPGSGAPNRPFDFFSVHFDLTLPNNSSFQITGGEFDVSAFASSGPFGVGPGVPNDIVPDSGSTVFVFSIASLALFALRRTWRPI
jgi:hypothetical protein